MSVRSLNKVMLIGNLTRDPELRYTPSGAAVCSFGLATNRAWTTKTGETKEDTEFHRIVAWNKLAEICSQLLSKGRKVFIEGRLSTGSWTGSDGVKRTTTEIVISEMIILDPKPSEISPSSEEEDVSEIDIKEDVEEKEAVSPDDEDKEKKDKQGEDKSKKEEEKQKDVEKSKEEKDDKRKEKGEEKEDINPDDIPF